MATKNENYGDDTCSRLLFVEGVNDCHIVAALCKANKLPHSFNIIDCKNDRQAQDKFVSYINRRNKTVLGLVLDADGNDELDNLQRRWQSLSYQLGKRNIRLPDSPNKGGVIIPSKDFNPTVGIWFMPDNDRPGMIEDFCCDIAANVESFHFARESVAEAEKRDLTSFKVVHKPKAEIHTYLAWQDGPGKPMGQAIAAKILNAKHPLAEEFSQWLKKLFKQQ